MQEKFLKQIVGKVIGEPAEQIVDLLSNKKDVNEFIIAKKLDITINQTRNLLYKLSHLGILSSIRKKDKRKGWYIYFWTLNVLRSLEILEEDIKKEIEHLEDDLKNKKLKRFYKCKICGIEVTEEAALLSEFTCSECGEVYILSDTVVHVESITKQIVKLKKELILVKIEREKEQLKKDKKLVRSIKKLEAEKKEKRRQTRMKKLRLKAKEERAAEKAKGKKGKAGKKPARKSKKVKKAKKVPKMAQVKKAKKG